MLWQRYKPGPPLSDFVDMLWYVEQPPQPHCFERLLPSARMQLILNLQEDCVRVYDFAGKAGTQEERGSVIVGPIEDHFLIDTSEQQRVVGVQFHPDGAHAFFALPMSELRSAHVALDHLWRDSGNLLRERLLAAATPERMFAVLEAELLDHLRVAQLDRGIRRAAHELASGYTVAAVADRLGISARQLSGTFARHVGFTPKAFSRICRFQRVVRTVHSRMEVEWTQVALSCGYYDQAHFNHDFRDFSGFTPSQYLIQRSIHLNHVPL